MNQDFVIIMQSPKKPRGRPPGVTGRGKTPPKRSRAGRPTAAELARRKNRVMEVATAMFIERGYAGTTLLDIAKEAGVATRTLAQHFGEKQDLFREVILVGDAEAIEPIELADDDDLRSALFKGAVYICHMSLSERSTSLTRLMVAESGRFPEMITATATDLYMRFLDALEHLFRDLATRGLIPEGDQKQSGELFADLVVGSRLIMSYFGWMKPATFNDDIERKVDLFIKGRYGDAFLPKA
jgi:TetR/AcrR family transcriptional repressor of mexJK operon